MELRNNKYGYLHINAISLMAMVITAVVIMQFSSNDKFIDDSAIIPSSLFWRTALDHIPENDPRMLRFQNEIDPRDTRLGRVD